MDHLISMGRAGCRLAVRMSFGALALLLVFANADLARAEPVVLPDTGVDLPGTVTAMVTFLGTAVAAIILAYAAFRAIRMALRWFGRIGG